MLCSQLPGIGNFFAFQQRARRRSCRSRDCGARDTATNPAVLTAFALAIIAGGGPSAYPGIPGHKPDLRAARKDAGDIEKAMDELRKVVPDAGSYVSESNFFNRAWQRSFWGPNYSRLRAVKAKYDP